MILTQLPSVHVTIRIHDQQHVHTNKLFRPFFFLSFQLSGGDKETSGNLMRVHAV